MSPSVSQPCTGGRRASLGGGAGGGGGLHQAELPPLPTVGSGGRLSVGGGVKGVPAHGRRASLGGGSGGLIGGGGIVGGGGGDSNGERVLESVGSDPKVSQRHLVDSR